MVASLSLCSKNLGVKKLMEVPAKKIPNLLIGEFLSISFLWRHFFKSPPFLTTILGFVEGGGGRVGVLIEEETIMFFHVDIE